MAYSAFDTDLAEYRQQCLVILSVVTNPNGKVHSQTKGGWEADERFLEIK